MSTGRGTLPSYTLTDKVQAGCVDLFVHSDDVGRERNRAYFENWTVCTRK